MIESTSDVKKTGMKSWRLMVKNLPFDTTVEELQNAFGKYGELAEVNLPKCRDKRFPKSCAGFCFLQYAKRKSADFALKGIPGASFKGRTLAASFALNKDAFVTKQMAETNEKTKLESKLKEILGVNGQKASKKKSEMPAKTLKTETVDKTAARRPVVVESELNDVDSDEEDKSEEQDDVSSWMDVDEKTDVTTSDDEDEEEDSNQNHEKPVAKKLLKKEANNSYSDSDDENDFKMNEKPAKKAPHQEDAAVLEGRVIFLRNLDFNATADTLRETAARFGDVTLAIQCKYPGSDQPTGTAFVHFREKSAADAFLNQLLKPDGVEVNGRQLYGHRAMPRAIAAAEFAARPKKEPADRRNLQLLRASLIREGTAEARGMSDGDAQLRKRLVLAAKSKLKDLTKFVSPVRLAIHNIPFTMTDEKLRVVCLAAAKNPTARVTEARIMRDTLGRDERGRVQLGRSKGFGFVTFIDHADALACLRAMNNNPKTFTDERRPIVEFSIENLTAIQAKERRAKEFKQRQAKKEADVFSTTVPDGVKRKATAQFTPSASLNDPSALLETKRQLMGGGRKWLPKRLGQKVRHRDLRLQGKPSELKKSAKPLNQKPAAKRFKK